MLASTREPEIAQLVEQRVAVARSSEQEQARQHDGAASQFLPAAGQEFGEVHVRHYSVCHTLMQVAQRFGP